MGAYGSPELHPKILEQMENEKPKKEKVPKSRKFACPHCGKEFYMVQKLTPVQIVQYSLAFMFSSFAVSIALIAISSAFHVILGGS
jgi:hypothetical protein